MAADWLVFLLLFGSMFCCGVFFERSRRPVVVENPCSDSGSCSCNDCAAMTVYHDLLERGYYLCDECGLPDDDS